MKPSSPPGSEAPPAKDSARKKAWTVGELLRWTESHFRRLGFPTPKLDAELLLAHALGSTRLELYTGYGKVVEPDERARFRELVRRRSAREPVAYILGEKEFYSLRFRVGPEVLIPRPETEHVVEAALAALRDPRLSGPAPRRVLDLGTGSGNIAIALLVEEPRLEVDAVDIRPEALRVAKENALRHGVAERLRLFCGDLFAPLGRGVRSYAAIVSNPPYIAAGEFDALMDDVRRYEPRSALLDTKSPGGDGLGFYRAILAEAPAFLEPWGVLVVEVGAGQAEGVRDLYERAGFVEVATVKDYAGIERVVTGRAKPA